MNETYFDKRRERINQKVKVLVARPDFQTDIAQLRNKWNVPPDGIKEEDKIQEWYHWLDEETDKYFKEKWPAQRSYLESLAKDGKLAEKEESRKQFNASAPLNAFQSDVGVLVNKYKLPQEWHNPVKRYLLFDSSHNLGVPLGNVSIQIAWDDKTGRRQLSLILNADTTIEDIKSFWPQVMLEQARLRDKTTKKFQPIPNLDRDKRICELAEQGKSYEDVATVIRGEFKVKSTFGYDDVSKALHRYRKRLGHK